MEYNPSEIEKRWKKWWADHQVYKVSNDSSKPKYYVLDMFPYPSGAGLHVGHPLGYIGSDIFARYKRQQGYNVLHPMGYDAFGLPAEQYAIQTGVHPAKSTAANIARYREQLDKIGFSFDWSREVQTSDPSYYKWTQWIFLQLFDHWYCNDSKTAHPIKSLIEVFESEGNARVNAATTQEAVFSASQWAVMSPKEKDDVLMNYRLAYRKTTYVWWCEDLGTVLANDEVKDGVSERGGYPVERKPMLQWSLRITAYADRLLSDLDTVDFSDAMKKMQGNWIGKSQGAQMFFDLENGAGKLEIFTTRPDTIFGATFMVIAPEHDLVKQITSPKQAVEIADYLAYVNTRSERDRMSETKEVSGAFTGAYAINPFNGERIPIWIAEYVLKDYGTGAIMAVPADDERDMRFAKKFNLPIVEIIDKSMYPGATIEDKLGKMINSDFLDGMEVKDAIEEILQRIETMGIGVRKINFRLRDAIYSRQRYWGEPFPIAYDPDGVAHPLPIEELPLELPELDDFKPASGAKSPLARAENWVNFKEGWRRETDTMPGFAGSSWYFLRYMDAENDGEFASQKALNYWQDVDLYVGGTEHAVGHLMYSRFWHKFLYDKGLVPTKEPYKKLLNQGMIQGKSEKIWRLGGMYFTASEEKEDEYAGGESSSQFWAPSYLGGLGAEGWHLHQITKTAHPTFYSADIKNDHPNCDELSSIRISVDLVKNYESNDPSYLDKEGLIKLEKWRDDFLNGVFVTRGGFWHRGEFHKTVSDNVDDDISAFYTTSEIGKMSKSWYNVINPDKIVEQYGADCFRMYEMFLGPIEQAKPWDTKGINGVSGFLRKLWMLFFDENNGRPLVNDAEPTKEEWKILHTCIKKVTDDIERFSFNTCVSSFMICVNELRSANCSKRAILDELVRLLAPFAPFTAEELWHQLGHETTVCEAPYPKLNEAYLVQDSIQYPVSINGKKRDLVELPAGMSVPELEKAALELDSVKKWLEGQAVKKIIVVPGRMINIVV